MINFLSASEMIYKAPLIVSHVSSAAKTFPVVVITGARQVACAAVVEENMDRARPDPRGSCLFRIRPFRGTCVISL
jgi:hypothetical protein